MDGDSNVIVTDGFTCCIKDSRGTKIYNLQFKTALKKNFFLGLGHIFLQKSSKF